MNQPIFIIEHLEPELASWSLIEYKHISKIVGKNALWFTNIKRKEIKKLSPYGKVFTTSVKNLWLRDTCILDPQARQLLTSLRALHHHYFIFGGILGDSPPKKRTGARLTKFIGKHHNYNLGKEQMSTDNAVFVTKKIIDGTSLNKLKFQDCIEIKLNSITSTLLPYRYVINKGKPLISPKLIHYLKNH